LASRRKGKTGKCRSALSCLTFDSINLVFLIEVYW
jgi:hypothetical protein